LHRSPRSTLFPYTTLFRSAEAVDPAALAGMTLAGPRTLAAATSAQPATAEEELMRARSITAGLVLLVAVGVAVFYVYPRVDVKRSEEHTSELQSRGHLVCR